MDLMLQALLEERFQL